VDEAEIQQSGKDKFKRMHIGYCPTRDDWDGVKPLVMLIALRIKFKVCVARALTIVVVIKTTHSELTPALRLLSLRHNRKCSRSGSTWTT